MKKILISLAILTTVLSTSSFVFFPQTAAAAQQQCEKDHRFLLFKPWYHGIIDKDCNIKKPDTAGNKTESGLQTFIWTIVLNIVEDMLIAVGYACVGFIMFGGFKYMASTGDAGKMTQAKTTIMNAIIGLIIAIISVGVVNLIAGSI